MAKRPALSVIMAVRDVGATVDDQLAALAEQEAEAPWELVVVDNGSTDDTLARAAGWSECFPAMRIVRGPPRPALGRAKNLGIDAASADRLAFCDGDDVVSPSWVDRMAAALEHEALVTGPLELGALNDGRALGRATAKAWMHGPPTTPFLPFAMGCNLGVRQDALSEHGTFDEGVVSGEDVELSWRLQLAGRRLHFEPGALVHRRMRTATRAAMRQHYRYGRSNVRLHKRFRRQGAPRSSLGEAGFAYCALVGTSPLMLMPRWRYRWATAAGVRAGRLVASVRERVLYL